MFSLEQAQTKNNLWEENKTTTIKRKNTYRKEIMAPTKERTISTIKKMMAYAQRVSVRVERW